MVKRFVKRALTPIVAAMGFEIRLIERTTADGSHASIRPNATYSPWNTDAAFRRVHDLIRPNTLVDQYRCYDLWTLLAQLRGVPGAFLEVGVWNGGSGTLIATRAAELDAAAPVYLCDTFTGVVKATADDPIYRGGEHSDAARANVERLLDRAGLRNVTILQGIFPDDTAARIPDQSFRFGHIDVDVFASAQQTFEWLWPRLSPGGVVVFDDYGFFGCDGVRSFVDSLRGRNDLREIYNLNGHAILVKVAA
jgi:O-methyltransferase